MSHDVKPLDKGFTCIQIIERELKSIEERISEIPPFESIDLKNFYQLQILLKILREIKNGN